MTGLVLSLRPNEKFIVNGIILENGDRRAQIRVGSDTANVLRLSNAIHPKDVVTPVQRAYYYNQLIITGDRSVEEGMAMVFTAIEELHHAFVDKDARQILDKARLLLTEKKFYSVLIQLKRLIPLEQALLGMADEVDPSTAIADPRDENVLQIANLR